jgi:hypothetical protein
MLYDTESADLIDFAKRWADLGNAVADQVVQVLDCPRLAADLNPDRADLEVKPERDRACPGAARGPQRGDRPGVRGVLRSAGGGPVVSPTLRPWEAARDGTGARARPTTRQPVQGPQRPGDRPGHSILEAPCDLRSLPATPG